MKLIFENADFVFEFDEKMPVSIDVNSQKLFSRLSASLVFDSDIVPEKFIYLQDKKEVSFVKNSICVLNPLDLPFKNATLLNSLYKKMDNQIRQDGQYLLELQELHNKLRSFYQEITNDYFADYFFDVELDVKKYLKSFGYSNYFDLDSSLLDNIENFLEFCADVCPDKVIFFINLKNFLTEIEYFNLCKYIFYLKIPVICLNSGLELYNVENDINYTIDLDFFVQKN